MGSSTCLCGINGLFGDPGKHLPIRQKINGKNKTDGQRGQSPVSVGEISGELCIQVLLHTEGLL
jgi:hypothetical protein